MKLQRLLLALQLSTVAVLGIPSATHAAVAPDTGVRLYTGINYTGKTFQFSPNKTNNVTLDLSRKDQISSIKVPVGFKVTLIDKDSKKSQPQTFEAGKHHSVGGAMDNKADVVVISRASSRLKSSQTISDYPSFSHTYA